MMHVSQLRLVESIQGGAARANRSLCGWNPPYVGMPKSYSSEPESRNTNPCGKVRVSGLLTGLNLVRSLLIVRNPKLAAQTHGACAIGTALATSRQVGPFVRRNPLTHHLGIFCSGLGAVIFFQSSVLVGHVKTDVLLN